MEVQRSKAQIHGVLFLLIGGALLAAGASAQPTDPPSSESQVRWLIGKLSDEDWKVRDDAQGRLGAMGPSAEKLLRERLKDAKLDPEERSRIENLLKAIDEGPRSGPSVVGLRQSAAPPKEVLQAIAKQTNAAFAPGAESLLADAKPFDVDFAGTPMWQAVLELCSKSGTVFQSVNRKGQVVLQPASPDVPAAPVATAGPFLVTVNRVEVNVSRGRDFAGQRPNNVQNNAFQNPPCKLYLFAWGEPRLKPVRWFIDEVEECVTDTGAKLESRGGWGGRGSVAGGAVNSPNETQFTLVGALDGAKRIERLRMRARFVLQRQTQKLELADVLSLRNSPQIVGGFPVEIVQVNKVVDGQYAYELRAKRGGRSAAEWEVFKSLLDHNPIKLLDAEGTALGFSGGGSTFGPDEVRITNSLRCEAHGGGKVAGEPVKLVWEFPSEVEQVSVLLELRDVPLP